MAEAHALAVAAVTARRAGLGASTTVEILSWVAESDWALVLAQSQVIGWLVDEYGAGILPWIGLQLARRDVGLDV